MKNKTKTFNQTTISEDFEFKALQEAKNYQKAIVNEFSPYLLGKTIEIGAGVGQMTKLFYEKNKNIIAIEPEEKFTNQFKESLPHIEIFNGTIAQLTETQKEGCESIVNINVIEHIEDHVEEVKRYYEVLKKTNGYLCILTPAMEELYSPIDKEFGHFRRYTKKSMKEVLHTSGFTIEKLHYFNFTGYFAWLLNFKILGSKSFNPAMVKLYDNTIFKATNAIETKVIRPPIGQSIIVIAKAIDKDKAKDKAKDKDN